MNKHADRFQLEFRSDDSRRLICGKEVILHCHHYNARLQATVEEVKVIDGGRIVRSAAETVFAEQIQAALRPNDDVEERYSIAADLYAHLGYGRLDFSRVGEGIITSNSSHFVEGWRCGLGGKERKAVCSFAEGFIQGAVFACSGKAVIAHEVVCMISGGSECRFELSFERSDEIRTLPKKRALTVNGDPIQRLRSETVDDAKILSALIAMPIAGGDDGLCPAFNVYLASTPEDYYNLVSILFIEEMSRVKLTDTAKALLVQVAETCALNTFRGIMNSPEWDGLIAPMVKTRADKLFALVAVSNALGWGSWHLTEHTPGTSATLASSNGYEAIGYLKQRGTSDSPRCYMLTGVAAGLMELVYGVGDIADRVGTCLSRESSCICSGGAMCIFMVEGA